MTNRYETMLKISAIINRHTSDAVFDCQHLLPEDAHERMRLFIEGQLFSCCAFFVAADQVEGELEERDVVTLTKLVFDKCLETLISCGKTEIENYLRRN